MNETIEKPEVADEVVEAASKSTAVALLGPLQKIRASLVTLAAEAKAFDLSTTAGDKEARAFRARCVSVRTSADRAYESANAPVLQAQKDARELRDAIKASVALIEDPIDAAIVAKEEAVKAERIRKAASEKLRQEAHATAVLAIRERVLTLAGMSAELIGQAIAALAIEDVGAERFEEFATAASRAKDETLAKLRDMHAAQVEHEAQRERERQQAEALEAERQQRLAEERAERERIEVEQRAERARLAAERAELERQQQEQRAEQVRLDAIAAAERKAADDKAAADREAADLKAAVERAEADRIAEEARIADAQILAARRAEIEKAEAAAAELAFQREEAERHARMASAQRIERVRSAGQALLDALVIAVPYVANHGTADELAQCNAAIEAAA